MNIGKLNNKVTILKKQSSGVFEEENFTPIAKVWSQITNVHGKEFIAAQSVNSNISKKITIRYKKMLDTSLNPNATKDYRIEYKGIQYNILYIDNIREENKFMELLLELI